MNKPITTYEVMISGQQHRTCRGENERRASSGDRANYIGDNIMNNELIKAEIASTAKERN